MNDPEDSRDGVPPAPLSPGGDTELLRLAGEIADARVIDWDGEATRLRGAASDTARRLRQIAEVAQAFRQPWAGAGPASAAAAPAPSSNPLTPGSSDVLFRWGNLDVLEKLGEGSFGEVFRAFDPALQRMVALKLRRADPPEVSGEAAGGGSARRFLDEGRRLARVRHPNVLFVHGADVHDGRVGLWTDLVEGKTLQEWVTEHGPLGAPEAALIGLDLCRALAAVHGAGLVHGDLKPANVMREQGGRIILMDFGSVSDVPAEGRPAGAAAAVTFGTPLSMAPEVLEGEPPSIAADLYALGVLLYWLVSRRYPVTGASQDELRACHARGASTPLRDVRPDLPAPFVHAVQRALAAQPADRFTSAGALEAALALAISAPAPSATAPVLEQETPRSAASGAPHPPLRRATPATRRALWALATAAVVIAAVALPLTVQRQKRPAPAVLPSEPTVAQPAESAGAGATDLYERPMPAAATFYRVREGARETLLAGSWIEPGDHLYLEFVPDESLHVYVINEDEHGELFVLFPVAGLLPANPLAGGIRHRLPGTREGALQDWQVSSAGGRESFLLVAAREPVALLEDEVRRQHSVDPERPVVYATLNLQALRTTRGVGTLADAAPDSARHAGSRIQELIDLLGSGERLPEGIWVRVLEVNNPGS